MTSNIGSPILLEASNADIRDSDGAIPEKVRKQVLAELRTHFRPEFLNRVDEIVMFKPLTLAEITQIVDLLMTLLRQRLADRKITIELTAAAKEYIAREGYDPVFGARPLKRFLQREVETNLSRKLLKGEIPDGSHVTVDFKSGALTFTAK
jgi:ATP-dependent Clp protease ATP-binding subunit ClpB